MDRYVIRGGQVGYDRLLLLARERRQDTVDLLHRAGVGPEMRCVDLGCGGGAVTFELARLVGPGGAVTGVDQDEVKLDLARRYAAQHGMDNVEFAALDVTRWTETGAYDVVYGRFLLQHLRDPVDMLRRMWAGVRPGGRLIIEDAEFDGCFSEPRNEGFELFLRVYPQLLSRYGGDASIGRKLHKYFRLAAIPSPRLTVVDSVHASGDQKSLRLSTLEATADAMLAAGLASDGELTAAVASLAEFTADPDTVIGGPRVFQAWSAKPGPPAHGESDLGR